jgi:hypothetical protein
MPKKTTKETVRVITPQELVAAHEVEVGKSLQKHNLKPHLFVHFPNRKRTPFWGLVGVWLVNKAGGIIATKYQYLGGTINSNSRRKT